MAGLWALVLLVVVPFAVAAAILVAAYRIFRWSVLREIDHVRAMLPDQPQVTGLVPGRRTRSAPNRQLLTVAPRGAVAGLVGYLVAAIAPSWVTVVVVLLVALVLLLSLSGVLNRDSSSARVVAFTADGMVWLLELGPAIGRRPMATPGTRR